MQEIIIPQVVWLPQSPPTPSRLVCRHGWGDETTHAFETEDFEQLQLWGTVDEAFRIPKLSEKAGKVSRLRLAACGEVHGLEQFAGVRRLSIDPCPPRNGIKLGDFCELKTLSVEWRKSLDKEIFACHDLRELDVNGYPGKNLSALQSLVQLRTFGMGGGSVNSLTGIEACGEIEIVGVAYARALVDVEALYLLNNLRNLILQNAPKLNTEIQIARLPSLRSIYVVSAPITLDLSGVSRVGSIEEIFIDVPDQGLDPEELMGIRSLRRVGLLMGERPWLEELALKQLAAKFDRDVTSVRYTRHKTKGRHVLFTLK